MGKLFSKPGQDRTKRPASVAMRSLFHNFRLILEHNTDALELMAQLERALGGEYIFDRAFLEKTVRDLGLLVQRVVYRLNNLTGDRYVELFDRYQAVRTLLDDILAGGPDLASLPPVLSFTDLGWETEQAVGAGVASLAELKHRFGLPMQDGFALTAAGVRLLLAHKTCPPELQESLQREAAALRRRCGRACPLAVAVHRLGAADLPGEPLALARHLDDLPLVIRLALTRHISSAPAAPADAGLSVSVREAPEPALRGVVRTLDHTWSKRDALSVSVSQPGTAKAGPSGEGGAGGGSAPGKGLERHLVRRSYPFRAMRSEILAKPGNFDHPDGGPPLSLLKNGLLRGTALLATKTLADLAEACMAVERVLGAPQELGWILTPRGRLLLTSTRPLARKDEAPEELDEILAGAVVLACGGSVAQAGVGAGRVVHVRAGDDPEDFPLGAVAVAHVAAPRLSPVLRRASALVTEVGTTVGHLATIAREYRVPALFGLPDALTLLPMGADVTVDASADAQSGTVYQGVLEPLLRLRSFGPELDPGDQEYALLRRILRLIRPLNLLDPEAADFTPAGCRTFHDLIHFAHEKAVEELAEIHARQPGLDGADARRLTLGVPMDIRVLDIGDGLGEGVAESAGHEITVDQLACAPLVAFLHGLCSKNAWRTDAAGLSAGDVLGGLRKTYQLMNDPTGAAGQNLAIVARGYMNLSLRLGYHFSVVDAHLGDNPNQNAIYFRFVGGLADERRRERRAKLIRIILEGLGFQVVVNQDLVVGKFKVADRPDMEAVLSRLGELTAFTRQLDTDLSSDVAVASQASAFLGLSDQESARADGQGGGR